MRRSVAVIAGRALAISMAPAPSADALAAGACAITGTIAFTPSASSAERGAWEIGPAVISCRGPFRAPHPEQMSGEAGSFSGIGSYTAVPSGGGHRPMQLRTGNLDYADNNEGEDVHLKGPPPLLPDSAPRFLPPATPGPIQHPPH